MRSRTFRSSAGPSISGITTSEIIRSILSLDLVEHLERLLAAIGLEHLVAGGLQRPRGEGADDVLVLDEEDALVAGEVLDRRLRPP